MSGLFGRPANAVQDEVYAGIQVSTSQYGQPIPYVAGRQRIPFTLGWYGNFVAAANSSGGTKGGGGSGTKSYTYSAAYIALLSLGPIVGVYQVWHDKAIVTLANENLALSEGGAGFTGQITATTLTASNVIGLIQVGAALTCAAVTPGTTITALGTGTGGAGTYTISPSQSVSAQVMSSSQNTWTGYPSSTTTIQKIPYDHIAYVASNAYNLGSSAAMPNLSFEVEGSIPGFSDAHGMFDADPSAVIIQYNTDPVIGAGFQGTIQTLTGATNTYQAYCMSLGLLISPYENTQRAATDFLKELLQITNSDMFLTVGQMRIMPLGDQAVGATTPDGSVWSWTPNLTPQFIFTDDHYVPQKGDPPVKLTRRAKNDTHNMVNLEYVDRTNYYNTAPVNASIISDIALYGPRLMSSLTFHQITNAQTALTVAQLILQADLYERNTYEFRVRQDFCQLEPLDYIAINDTALGLVNQVCRIQEVSDDADDFLTFKVLEMPGVTRSTPQYNWNAAAGYFANYATAPGSIQAPAIFTMPAVPAAKAYTDGIVIGIAVAPLASQSYWAGCHVWMSVDGGSTYILAGIIPTAAKYGTISATIAAATVDPDITHTLSVSLIDTAQQLSTATTHANADSAQTLVLVGSGTTAEVMAFGTAALVSAGNYNLTYLRRFLYGSINQSHTSGAQFVRLDGNIFMTAVDPGYGGQTLYFKFTSFNTWQKDEETLSAATAYSYTVPSGMAVAGAVQFLPRGNAALAEVGTVVYKNAGAASAWDSDAVSSGQAFDALSVYTIYSVGQNMAFGLSPNISATLNPNNTAGGGTFDFCFYIVAGTWNIYEDGVSKATLSAAVIGDIARITYDRFTVRYYINGALVRQIPVPVPGALEFIGFTLYEASDVWGSIEAGAGTIATPQQFIARGFCQVNDTAVVKTAGAGAYNSDVVSINGYVTCHLVFKFSATNIFVGPGLSTQIFPTIGSNFANYAIFSNGSGGWGIFESNVSAGVSGTYVPTDIFAITYDGATVTYWKNNVSLRTVSVAGLTLFAFIPVYSANDVINSLEFGPTATIPLADTGQINANAVSQIISNYNASGVLAVYPGSSTPTLTNLISATIVCTGSPIAIDAMANVLMQFTTSYTLNLAQLVILRDGTALSNVLWDGSAYTGATALGNIPVTITLADAPTAGSHTYTLAANLAGTNHATGNFDVNCTQLFIKVREIKK
jgi:hypothetical protein